MNSKLLKSDEFIEASVKDIDAAKNKIVMISMVISDDDATKDLIDSLKKAAQRGVEVKIAADYFTFITLGGFLVFNHFKNKHVKNNAKSIREMREKGIKFTWLGQTNWSIMSGRTHSKWLCVDENVYAFGGINFYKEGLENCDYMFRTKSQELSEKLSDEFDEIIESDKKKFSPKNKQFNLGEDKKVLIDGGFVGKSIIYSRICALAKDSRKITLVSQYPPTGKFARILKLKIKNRDEINLYFNSAKTARSSNKIIIKFGEIMGLNNLYEKPKYLHSKFIIFEDKNGLKTAISGSHNFTAAGGIFGTREIALETKSADFIFQLEKFREDEVA